MFGTEKLDNSLQNLNIRLQRKYVLRQGSSPEVSQFDVKHTENLIKMSFRMTSRAVIEIRPVSSSSPASCVVVQARHYVLLEVFYLIRFPNHETVYSR